MTIKDDCHRLFKTDDLYKVLGLEKSDGITDEKVKRAYSRAAWWYHPWNHWTPLEPEKSEVTEKFDTLSKVYTILVDSNKRHTYDISGEVPTDLVFESNFDWYGFWQDLHGVTPSGRPTNQPITTDQMKSLEKTYKGSAEEREDLKRHYIDGDGQMDYIMATLFFATYEDEDRVANMLKELIATGELKDNHNFSKEPAEKKMARWNRGVKEAAEAAEAQLNQSDGESSSHESSSTEFSSHESCSTESPSPQSSSPQSTSPQSSSLESHSAQSSSPQSTSSVETIKAKEAECHSSAEELEAEAHFDAKASPIGKRGVNWKGKTADEEPAEVVDAPVEPPVKMARGKEKKMASSAEQKMRAFPNAPGTTPGQILSELVRAGQYYLDRIGETGNPNTMRQVVEGIEDQYHDNPEGLVGKTRQLVELLRAKLLAKQQQPADGTTPLSAKAAGVEDSADDGTSAEGNGAEPAEQPEISKEK